MRAVHLLARLVGEGRVIGARAFISPWLLAAPLAVAAEPLRNLPGMRSALTFVVWLTLQGLLPLLVGMLTAGLVPGEAAGETMLPLPHPYRQIALTRLLLVMGASALAEVVAICALYGVRDAPVTPFAAAGPTALFAALLTCLAPLACCSTLGWMAAIALRSASASRALLMPVWVGLLAASAGVSSPERWALVQSAYLAVGGSAAFIGWLCLRAPGNLFQRMEE